VRIVIGAGDVAVIEDISGNAVAPNHGDPAFNRRVRPLGAIAVHGYLRNNCARDKLLLVRC
jgi:acyl dehydratase